MQLNMTSNLVKYKVMGKSVKRTKISVSVKRFVVVLNILDKRDLGWLSHLQCILVTNVICSVLCPVCTYIFKLLYFSLRHLLIFI